jgi:hypothetical protein
LKVTVEVALAGSSGASAVGRAARAWIAIMSGDKGAVGAVVAAMATEATRVPTHTPSASRTALRAAADVVITASPRRGRRQMNRFIRTSISKTHDTRMVESSRDSTTCPRQRRAP